MRKTIENQTDELLSIVDASDLYEINRLQDAFSEALGLTSANALFASIYDRSPDVLVFALDREYKYLSFNEKHRASIQLTWGKEIAVGVNILEIIGNLEDFLKAKSDFDRVLSGERFTNSQSGGRWQNHWAPITGSDGSITGLSCFALNVTDRIKAHEVSLEYQLGMTRNELKIEKI